MNSIAACIRHATAMLESVSSSAQLDAQVLMAHTLSKTRTFIYTHSEYVLNEPQLARYSTLIEQRMQGTPIAYLIGEREFWSMPLTVTPDTLIPRPETETLVECVLNHIDTHIKAHVLDLGTGSGAVALALAKERPHWQITACDVSQPALDVAQENAKKLGITTVHFMHSDWFSKLPQGQLFHAIVSNPPYITEHSPYLKEGDVRFEPTSALTSGSEGLTAIRHIVQYSKDWLLEQGWLMIEHGFDQKQAVQAILHAHDYTDIASWKDLQNHDRVTGARKPSVLKEVGYNTTL